MTNEILSVVLYFVSGVVITSIVTVILGIKNEINRLKQQTENFKFQPSTNANLFREVEELHRKVDKINEDIYHPMRETNADIYRYVDSRHDKLENKLMDVIKNGCEPVKSK